MPKDKNNVNVTSLDEKNEDIHATISFTDFKISLKAKGLLANLTRGIIISAAITLVAALITLSAKLI